MTDTTDRTRDHVEQMMRSSLDDLALTARAYATGTDVSDSGTRLVPKGDGIDAAQYARELVVDERTPKHGCCTDFVLALGGPRIWVRSWTRTDDAAIYGQANGMAEPVKWPIACDTDAHRAVMLLLDHDVMSPDLDPAPDEFAAHPDLARHLDDECAS